MAPILWFVRSLRYTVRDAGPDTSEFGYLNPLELIGAPPV